MLTVALDGSQDHLGCGDAARFWAEAGMSRRRTLAIAEVDAAWNAGNLRWDNHRDVIAPFPHRGQLDEYKEGQEDEGTARGAEPGSDREEPTDDEEPPPAVLAVAGSVKLTEEQRIEVGKLTERLRQVDNMLGIARDFGNAHVVQTL